MKRCFNPCQDFQRHHYQNGAPLSEVVEENTQWYYCGVIKELGIELISWEVQYVCLFAESVWNR